jgi:hypothetical protein
MTGARQNNAGGSLRRQTDIYPQTVTQPALNQGEFDEHG